MHGIVKWFNKETGCGEISETGFDCRDLKFFFHRPTRPEDEIAEGMLVEFSEAQYAKDLKPAKSHAESRIG